jgi:hypothetical protein
VRDRFRWLLLTGPLLALPLWLRTAHSAPPEPGPSTQPAAANTDTDIDARPIATFAGGRITLEEMRAAIANKVPRARAAIAQPGGRERFLAELVRYELLVLEATRRGYERNPLVIEAAQRAAIDRMLERDLAVAPASIPAAEVAAYYSAHAAELGRPALRRASHIELATEAEATQLIAQLRGVDRQGFAKLAVERSIDAPTKRQGGELGYFDREGHKSGDERGAGVPRALADAAYALDRVGAIGQRPVRLESGFSVVMLTGEMPELRKPLAKVEGKIREQLAEQRQAQALTALVAKLFAEHKPEVHAELLGAIALDPVTSLDQPEGFAAAPPDPRAPPRLVTPDGY